MNSSSLSHKKLSLPTLNTVKDVKSPLFGKNHLLMLKQKEMDTFMFRRPSVSKTNLHSTGQGTNASSQKRVRCFRSFEPMKADKAYTEATLKALDVEKQSPSESQFDMFPSKQHKVAWDH